APAHHPPAPPRGAHRAAQTHSEPLRAPVGLRASLGADEAAALWPTTCGHVRTACRDPCDDRGPTPSPPGHHRGLHALRTAGPDYAHWWPRATAAETSPLAARDAQ